MSTTQNYPGSSYNYERISNSQEPESTMVNYPQIPDAKQQSIVKLDQQQQQERNQDPVQGHPIQYPALDQQQNYDIYAQQQGTQNVFCVEKKEEEKAQKTHVYDPTKRYEQHVQVYTGEDEKEQDTLIYITQEKIKHLPLEPTSRKRQIMCCPHCKTVVKTKLKHEVGKSTNLLAAALFLTTVVLSPIPYMFKRTKDVIHICPKCEQSLGELQY